MLPSRFPPSLRTFVPALFIILLLPLSLTFFVCTAFLPPFLPPSLPLFPTSLLHSLIIPHYGTHNHHPTNFPSTKLLQP
ncbi:hypothetical protein HOY80DRAFT_953432 [Tuber brumale]|nr:hypothetical protein HOY80DRAFT_953432 [Tuber brumale]